MKNYFNCPSWTEYEKIIKERPEAFAQNGALEIILDKDTIAEFMKKTSRQIGVMYKSPYNYLIVDLVRDVQGNVFAYERLLPAVAEGAAVMVVTVNGKYAVLDQYRHAIREHQYCFPRGFGTAGLNAVQNALKEVDEEVHAEVKKIERIGTVVADSGILGSKVAIMKCESVLKNAELPNTEFIRSVKFLSAYELEELIATGQITDGFTLSAWALLKAKE